MAEHGPWISICIVPIHPPWIAIQAMSISPDLDYCWVAYPDMDHGKSLGPAPSGCVGHSDWPDPRVARPLDTGMAMGDDPDFWHQHCLR